MSKSYLNNSHTQEIEVGNPMELLKKILGNNVVDSVLKKKERSREETLNGEGHDEARGHNKILLLKTQPCWMDTLWALLPRHQVGIYLRLGWVGLEAPYLVHKAEKKLVEHQYKWWMCEAQIPCLYMYNTDMNGDFHGWEH